MKRTLSRHSRHGIVSIWTAIMLLVLITLIGLAMDTGYVYLTGQQLQHAADAAALAGAARVQFNQGQAVTEAVTTAAANKAAKAPVQLDSADGDVLTGNFDRSAGAFSAGGTPFNAVKVIARRTTGSPGESLPLIFGPIVGIGTANVSRQAIAMAGGTFAAGIVILDPTRVSSFGRNGNPTIIIDNGGIQVNSSNSAAVTTKGSSLVINATELRINGGMSNSGTPSLPAKTYTNTTPVPDPLAGVPVPTKGAALPAVNLTTNTALTIGPGYYPDGITQDAGTLTLSTGVYIVGPPGVRITKKATFSANGVMFYITTGNTAGVYPTPPFEFDSSGTVTITAPASGVYKGIAIFTDRATPYSVVELKGNTTLALDGTLYMPSLGLSLKGTCDFIAKQIISATLDASGTDTIRIRYDGRNVVTINNVFLVE